MKLILGVTIVLLALVSVGLAVYAYTEHPQVDYLTLRADHLERRINELEATTPLDNQALRQVLRNRQVDSLALQRRTLL
jgi:hypothetical protein